MNLKSLKERQCIKIHFVGKGEENMENQGINELHKNWFNEYITNTVRFVFLEAVIMTPATVAYPELFSGGRGFLQIRLRREGRENGE
jgi:hypothetical protein